MSSDFVISESISQKDFEKKVNDEIKKVIDFLEKELAKIRTNRSHPSMVEDLKIMAYGELNPLKNLAMITTPESNSIVISPFDPSIINDIEKILSTIDFGALPKNDGKTIKIILPPMSQTRRQELTKMVGKKQEETLSAVRKIRQEFLDLIKKTEKDKKISEDISKRLQKYLQNCIDIMSNTVSTISKKKEQALLD